MNIDENQDVFRECLSGVLIKRLTQPSKAPKKRTTKGRKNAIKLVERSTIANDSENDASELSEFIEVRAQSHFPLSDPNHPNTTQKPQYISTEIYTSLPPDLRSLTFETAQSSPTLAQKYDLPLSLTDLEALASLITPSTADSLTTYGLLSSPSDLPHFLSLPLTEYITSVTSPPPSATPGTKADACEICEREHIPLTYHHLVPRAVHDKVKKRGWHEEWRLNSVAWLCRACHSFVHGLAGNEELAREWYSVELLRGREDVQRWAAWMGKVRWKKR